MVPARRLKTFQATAQDSSCKLCSCEKGSLRISLCTFLMHASMHFSLLSPFMPHFHSPAHASVQYTVYFPCVCLYAIHCLISLCACLFTLLHSLCFTVYLPCAFLYTCHCLLSLRMPLCSSLCTSLFMPPCVSLSTFNHCSICVDGFLDLGLGNYVFYREFVCVLQKLKRCVVSGGLALLLFCDSGVGNCHL